MTILPLLRVADQGSGLSLLADGWQHAVMSLLLVAGAGVPALLLGVVASACGHPLSGVFAVAAALAVLAWRGGAIDDVLLRAASQGSLPGVYLRLMAEVLLWQVGVVVMMLIIGKLRSPLRARYPALRFDDHLGVDTQMRLPGLNALASGALCAAVAAALAHGLLRSSDAAQITWGLILAFTVGGLVSQSVLPGTNPVGPCFAPAFVAMAAYAWTFTGYADANALLAAFFNLNGTAATQPRLTGLALALPVHYMSAGLAGCAIGIAWAQALNAATLVRAAAR